MPHRFANVDLGTTTKALIKVPGKTPHILKFEVMNIEPTSSPLLMAYTVDDKFIGTPDELEMFTKKGIVPELASPDHSVCSIGFNEKEQKWYGWSHRARYGFGIGDKVEEGDCCNTASPDVALPVGFVAKTLDDAKKMAIAFAESVG